MFENNSDGDSYSDIGIGSVIVVNTGFKPKSKMPVHLGRLYTVGYSELDQTYISAHRFDT